MDSDLNMSWIGSMAGEDVIDGVEYDSVELQHLISCWRARNLTKYMGKDDGSTALKVLAYVIRGAPEKAELLVFKHKNILEAGIQVPAGTIQTGEAPALAARRELVEETGLLDVELLGRIDVYEWESPETGRWQRRHVYEFRVSPTTPDRWDHVVTGGEEDKGMIFSCHWLPIAQAKRSLAGEQGYSLRRLHWGAAGKP